MVEEAGGIINDISNFNIKILTLKLQVASINSKMIENLKNF